MTIDEYLNQYEQTKRKLEDAKIHFDKARDKAERTHGSIIASHGKHERVNNTETHIIEFADASRTFNKLCAAEREQRAQLQSCIDDMPYKYAVLLHHCYVYNVFFNRYQYADIHRVLSDPYTDEELTKMIAKGKLLLADVLRSRGVDID